MLPSLSSLALGAMLLLPASDGVPNFNVEPSCRAAAKMGDSMDATFRGCMADEQSARAELEKQWTQFPAGQRQSCLATTNAGGGPSYVEVLVCLQMARDASQDEKSSGNRGGL